MTRHLRDDIVLVVAAGLVASLLALVDGPAPARLAVGLPATFVLPGYAMSLALLPRGRIDAVERLVLSVSLSLALIIVVAPLLDVSLGVTSRPLVLVVTAITVGSAAAAWWRRRRERSRGTDRSPTGAIIQIDPRRLPHLPLLVVAFVIAAVMLTMATRPPPSTEFFAVGDGGHADTYPETVEAGARTTVRIAIANHEDEAASYRVVATSGPGVLAILEPIVLDPEQTWTGDVSFVLTEPGDDQMVTIDLFKSGLSDAYRSLRLWIDVLPGG